MLRTLMGSKEERQNYATWDCLIEAAELVVRVLQQMKMGLGQGQETLSLS